MSDGDDTSDGIAGRMRIVHDYIHFDYKADQDHKEAETEARNELTMAVFLAGPDEASQGECLRDSCGEPRWKVPTSESCLCRDHTLEVLRGEAKAPPLRRNIDYQYPGPRKTFLVEQLPDGVLPIYDKDRS